MNWIFPPDCIDVLSLNFHVWCPPIVVRGQVADDGSRRFRRSARSDERRWCCGGQRTTKNDMDYYAVLEDRRNNLAGFPASE